MPNERISDMPSATTPLAGTELVLLVQSGVNKQTAVSNIGSSSGSLIPGTTPTAAGAGAILTSNGSTLQQYLGTGANCVCIGPSTTATMSQSTSIGYNDTVSASNSTAVGWGNTIHNNAGLTHHSNAIGANNTIGTASSYASAMGVNNTTSGDYSIAIGYNNTASTLGGIATAIGFHNTASATYSVAIGSNNTASFIGASAIGVACTAGGDDSTAIGSNAVARLNKCTNIGGAINVRGWNSESVGNELWQFSGVKNTVFSTEYDLTATFTFTVNMPTTSLFYPSECGIIVTQATAVTGQPTIEFGFPGTPAGLVAAAPTSGLTTATSINSHTTLLTYSGQTSLTATVTVGGTATTLKGRFYFVGMLVEGTV